MDLNAPVAATGLTSSGTATSVSIYPILDNRNPASTTQCVQMPGFFVNPVGTTTFPTAATTTLNPPVMPVQWLYVLQDGTIIAPTGGSGGTATFTGATKVPSASNPIVGRIAYWTDDDTCKININTAAGSVAIRLAPTSTSATGKVFQLADGGVFYSTANTPVAPAPWDVPRYGGSWEDGKLFASDQPVAGEYQRYPGHPASTMLYFALRALAVSTSTGFNMPEVLFPKYNGKPQAYQLAYTVSGTSNDTQNGGNLVWPYTSALYGITPRYNDNGGSQGGIADTTHSTGTLAVTSISPTRYRLYTSLGELMYSPTGTTTSGTLARVGNNPMTGNIQYTGSFPRYGTFTRQQIETGKFFLTAHSRAPETTLFGTPRVTMWPIPDTQSTPKAGKKMAITTLDQLIKFCSTTDTGTGGAFNQYYFQRYDANSPTNDYNNESRNQALFGYLQDLTTGNIPGYGGNFKAKYGVANERDQILTEIFDYIRCTNLSDHSWTGSGGGNPIPSGSATFTGGTYGVGAPVGKGEVVPIQITQSGVTTSGLGRLLTLSEIAIHVICTADGNNYLATLNTSNSNTGYTAAGNTATSVAYNTPVTPTGFSAGTMVSPVIGSASDPGYVSNLPIAQFLRDPSNNIKDIFGTTVTSTNSSSCAPYPANQTLTTSYGGTLTALANGNKQLQAMLIFEPASPMNGYDLLSNQGGQGPDVNLQVTSIQNIVLAGQNPFPNRTDTTFTAGPNINGNGFLNGRGSTGLSSTNGSPGGWVNNGDSDQGGILGFRFMMASFSPTGTLTNINKALRVNGWSGVGGLNPPSVNWNPAAETAADTLGAFTTSSGTATNSPSTMWKAYTPGSAVPYRFVSNPFTVPTGSFTLATSGTFNVALTLPITASGTTTQYVYQNFNVSIPPVTLNSTPTLPAYGMNFIPSGSYSGDKLITHAPDWWNFDGRIAWANNGVDWYANVGGSASAAIGMGAVIRGDLAPPSSTQGWSTATSGTLAVGWRWWDTSTVTGTNTAGTIGNVTTTNTSYGDVVRSIMPKDGDYRLTMAKPTVNAVLSAATSPTDFSAPPQYTNPNQLSVDMLMEPTGSQGTTGCDTNGTFLNNLGSVTPAALFSPKVTSVFSNGTPDPKISGDWDTGRWGGADGSYANKPDEGNDYVGNGIPYVNAGSQASNALSSYYTANRMVTSAVMFGGLPTGVNENIPWRTLLFRPQETVANNGSRTTVMSPPGPMDYLLLDDFWMPIVQPYAISEPFSTAGKINMNYQILPFTHITRSTALQAVLGSELVARVPVADAAAGGSNAYYQYGYVTQGTAQSDIYNTVKNGSALFPARLPLNLSEVNGTLRQFRAKFTGGDIFRSPAEICDIYLVPNDPLNTGSYTGWTTNDLADHGVDGWYSTDFGLVGDNVRERPYGDLYPRLTTKSNTYTVYYEVQVLKNPQTADQTQWSENTGVVTGQYRGSTSLERYLDPNNNNIPDYTVSGNNPAATSTAKSLDNYYQWRTVANTAFNP